MVGLPIAVEINPPDAPREQVAILLAACARAAADAECVPAAEVSTAGSRAVAIVTWSGERRVMIEVGLRKDGRPEWRSRTLDFERIDDALERWRTIGFVVGTLARPQAELPVIPDAPARESSSKPRLAPGPPSATTPAPASPKDRAAPSKRAKAPPRPSKAVRKPAPAVDASKAQDVEDAAEPARTGSRSVRVRPAATLDLGGIVGPALAGMRGGGLARGRFRLIDVLGAVFAVRYLDRPIGDGSFGGRWITGSAGVGVELGSEQFTIGGSVDVRAEYFEGRAELAGARAALARWLPGVGLGVNGGWMATPTLGLFLGGDAAFMFGTTDLRVADDVVATDRSLRLGVEGGVRLRL